MLCISLFNNLIRKGNNIIDIIIDAFYFSKFLLAFLDTKIVPVRSSKAIRYQLIVRLNRNATQITSSFFSLNATYRWMLMIERVCKSSMHVWTVCIIISRYTLVDSYITDCKKTMYIATCFLGKDLFSYALFLYYYKG